VKIRIGVEDNKRHMDRVWIIIVIDMSRNKARTLLKCFNNDVNELRKYIERKLIEKLSQCI